jgi:uncharacterized protein YdeI (YjbR/CyaY-like superfamily)
MPESKVKMFRAPLERGDRRLGWVIARIPFDAGKLWGTKGLLKVKGAINGFPFRTSLFPTGDGHHILLVNKRMQAGGSVAVGEGAQFQLEPDTEERTVRMPAELAEALAEDQAVRRWYDRLNYSWRKEIANWITDVKSAEARERRAGQMAERLFATMEAERELPPFLRMAFARDGRAYEGWKRMSASHRRRHLFAIFYYRDPASRDRRVGRMIQAAREFAERRSP